MSKAERDRFDKSEQWMRIWRRDRGECVVCGKQLSRDGAQAAHLIANSKEMRKRYGNDVVNHDMAQVITCPGRCNDVVQVTHSDVPREDLAEIIRREDWVEWNWWMEEHAANVANKLAEREALAELIRRGNNG